MWLGCVRRSGVGWGGVEWASEASCDPRLAHQTRCDEISSNYLEIRAIFTKSFGKYEKNRKFVPKMVIFQ